MKKTMPVRIFLAMTLSLGFINYSFAEDAEVKLNTTDGSTKFIVQDKDAAAVFSADSAGNAVVNGTVTVAGPEFSVGGSTFVVKSGNVGLGTSNPVAKLEVAGQVKITGGAPGANKVLISDAGGLASWQADGTFAIGDSYGGGIVFWVDASARHGLIAATADQSTGGSWGTNMTTGATLDAVYAGKANTVRIITTQGAGYAAQICSDYSVTVNNEYYDDWYLPSRYELQLLYNVIGGGIPYFYWSSNENTSSLAWAVRFTDGATGGYVKTNPTYYVRCVRAGP